MRIVIPITLPILNPSPMVEYVKNVATFRIEHKYKPSRFGIREKIIVTAPNKAM